MTASRPIKVPKLPVPPPRFCNWARALDVMKEKNIDGLVLRMNSSVYYMSGFAPSGLNGSLFETDDSYGAVVISRHEPEHPIVLVPTLNVGYFLHRPTWIQDIRAFSTGGWGATTALHVAETPNTPELEFKRYVPRAARETTWGRNAQRTHEPDFLKACRKAMHDLGLSRGTIGFDDLRFAAAFASDSVNTVDALAVIRYIREIKTPEEVSMLGQAIRINQRGIEEAVRDWYPGMTWNELQHVYLRAVIDQGGFVRLKLADLFQSRQVARDLVNRLDSDQRAGQRGQYFVTDWTRSHANFFRAVQIEKNVMFIILTLIVAVAAFNIVSTLVMAVTDKRADIAILRTLGASPGGIMRIFIVQGALIGVIGTAIGVAGGVLLALNVGTVVPFLENLIGIQFLAKDVYYISELPSDLQRADVLTIAAMSLVLSLLATLYPSWRASRVNPAEALRYE